MPGGRGSGFGSINLLDGMIELVFEVFLLDILLIEILGKVVS